jgi:PAS domain S-box-containing protein
MSNELEQPVSRPGTQGSQRSGSAARMQSVADLATETDERLRNIAAGVSAATGEAFFRLLTRHLCLALKTDFACIGELNGNQGTVQTIMMFDGAEFLEGLEYVLAGTPCREAIMSGRCSYPRGVQASFPSDHLLVDMGIQSYFGVALRTSTGEPLGVMSVMSRSPLENVDSAEAILSIFAARASAELERRRWERALHESEVRNRAILSALPDTIFVVDRQGVILDFYAKDPVQMHVGPELIRGNKLETVLTPEVVGLILSSSTTLEPGSAAVVEYSLQSSDQLRFYEMRTVHFGDDKFLSIVRDVTSKKRTESELKESQWFAQRIAETTPNVLFVYDLIERRNVYTNERSVDVLGYTPKEIEDMGENFIPQLMHPDDFAALPALAKEYAVREDGEVFNHVFRLKHKDGQWRWLHRTATIFSRTPDGSPKQILGAVTDITKFKQTERDLHELSARLLSAQDEERRRIARELHDTTGQNLTAMGLHLEAIEKSDGMGADVKTLVSECRRLCRESQKEMRTMSYLLHPPELDLLGLVDALRWYVEGFEKRTGIHALLEIKADIGRLPSDLETDLFRVIQEGLTNIVRHSGSKTAVIRLQKTDTELTLQVIDTGCGFPYRTTPEDQKVPGFGVGIPGMRERLRQHGGTLEISSNGQGTILTGVVPLRPGKERILDQLLNV